MTTHHLNFTYTSLSSILLIHNWRNELLSTVLLIYSQRIESLSTVLLVHNWRNELLSTIILIYSQRIVSLQKLCWIVVNRVHNGYKLSVNWVYNDCNGCNLSINWVYNGYKLSDYSLLFFCISSINWVYSGYSPSNCSILFCYTLAINWVYDDYKLSEPTNYSKNNVTFCRIWSNRNEDSVISSRMWLNYREGNVVFCHTQSKYSEDSGTFYSIWSNRREDIVTFCRILSKRNEDSGTFCYIWSIDYLSPHTPSCGLAWCSVQHELATVIVSEMCLIVGCTLVSLLASGIVSSSSFSSNIECGTESVVQSRVPLCTQWLAIVLVFVVFDMELLLTVLSGMVLTSWVASLIMLTVLVFITITLYWELLSDQLIWVL